MKKINVNDCKCSCHQDRNDHDEPCLPTCAHDESGSPEIASPTPEERLERIERVIIGLVIAIDCNKSRGMYEQISKTLSPLTDEAVNEAIKETGKTYGRAIKRLGDN